MLAAVIVVALTGVSAAAQYGHPLKGTWSGDWGPNKETRHRVLLELHWDGKAITGTINPGPNAVRLQKASLDPAAWDMRLEGEGRDASGAPCAISSRGRSRISAPTGACSPARGHRARSAATSG